MEKTTKCIYIIGFMLLMVTFMNGTVMQHHSKHVNRKLRDTDCIKTTIRNEACHADRCHNSTTYIHGCDTYDSTDECDNLTVTYNVHNSSAWRNTTCNLYACGDIINDDECADGNLTFSSCTNGDCHSGITRIHGCFSPAYMINKLTSPSVLSFLGISDSLKDFFDIPCINLLFDVLNQQRFHNKKIK